MTTTITIGKRAQAALELYFFEVGTHEPTPEIWETKGNKLIIHDVGAAAALRLEECNACDDYANDATKLGAGQRAEYRADEKALGRVLTKLSQA